MVVFDGVIEEHELDHEHETDRGRFCNFTEVPGEALYVNAVTLENGGKWNITATTTIDTLGNYMVVYELWTQKENSALEFTGNACVLNVEAINQT